MKRKPQIARIRADVGTLLDDSCLFALSAVFASGRKFANIDELKQLLLADKDQLARLPC
jgi:hypothetical protein